MTHGRNRLRIVLDLSTVYEAGAFITLLRSANHKYLLYVESLVLIIFHQLVFPKMTTVSTELKWRRPFVWIVIAQLVMCCLKYRLKRGSLDSRRWTTICSFVPIVTNHCQSFCNRGWIRPGHGWYFICWSHQAWFQFKNCRCQRIVAISYCRLWLLILRWRSCQRCHW